MLLSVPADVKQAMIIQVKFQKWLSKMKVTGIREDSDPGAETKSDTHCVKSVPVNPEKNYRSAELQAKSPFFQNSKLVLIVKL